MESARWFRGLPASAQKPRPPARYDQSPGLRIDAVRTDDRRVSAVNLFIASTLWRRFRSPLLPLDFYLLAAGRARSGFPEHSPASNGRAAGVIADNARNFWAGVPCRGKPLIAGAR